MSITTPPPWYVSGEEVPDPYDIPGVINSLGIKSKKRRRQMIEEAYEKRANRKWYQDYNGDFPSYLANMLIWITISFVISLLIMILIG